MQASEYFERLAAADIRGRVYIAGPMRGIDQLNHPAFYAAEKIWRRGGWLVVNPARLDGDTTDMTFEACMRRDIRKLMDCHAVAFLPGWERSQGANWEAAAGVLVGNHLFYADSGNPVLNVRIQLSVNDRKTPVFNG